MGSLFLKEVALRGFKSFPNKTILQFNENLTAIVGPNGSGKSNIVDAIQWVLGEHSAKSLRGSKMVDLIFSGSSKRSGSNSAEVTLTFDNTDGAFPLEEKLVTVTRRINREGESAFFINEEPCRLKDIQDLLIDGGIHKDSSSILGQGKIETLLMSKPTDRRELFEEAAGIIKYKIRKKEALTKIANTDQQIRRIRDIIHEINRQARPLRQQVRLAKEYIELQKSLADLEVNLLMNKYKEMESQRLNLQAALAEKEAELSANKNKQGKIEAITRQIVGEVKKLTEVIDTNRDLLYKKQSKVEMLHNKIEMGQERLVEIEEQRKERIEDIKQLGGYLAGKEEEKAQIDQDLAAGQTVLEEYEGRLASFSRGEKENLAYWDDLLKKKELYRESIREILNESSRQRHMLQENEGQAARLETRIQEVESMQEEAEKNLESFRVKKAAVEEQLKEKKQYHAKLQEKQMGLESLLAVQRKELQELEGEQKLLQIEYDSLQGKLALLKEFKETDYEFSQGVKAILQESNAGRLTGIIGVVAELYRADAKYSEAIAAALGGRNQNIIVRSAAEGEKAIDFLKRKGAGRVTLLPLNLVSVRGLHHNEKQVLNLPGVCGTVLDLIEYPPEYHNAFAHLLGNVLVTSTLKEAVAVSRNLKNRLRVVTLEGDVINPGGAMTGGARLSRPATGKKSNVVAMEKQIAACKARLTEVDRRLLEAENKYVTTQKQQKYYQEELTGSEIGLRTCEKDLEIILENEEKQRANVNQFEQRCLELEKELAKVISSIDAKQAIFFEHQKKYQEERRKSQEVEAAMEKLRLEIGDTQGQLMDIRVEITGKRHECNHLRQMSNQLQQTIVKIQNESKDKEKQITDLANSILSLQGDLATYARDIISINEIKTVKEDELAKNRQQKKQLQEILISKENELAQINEQVVALEGQISNLQLRLGNINDARERISENLRSEYDLTIEEAEGMIDDCFSLANADEEIKKLKERRRMLGPVNLGAIEEYKELETRLNFMREQHKDLRDAQKTLKQIIASIDKTMEAKFLATFKNVAKEFEGIFKHLFQGGRAELYLSNEENLLETGVEVVAQPPGKKLQKLSLMSGGEKALAAIALLFAVLRVKPSPFYILDEIDAPLDEANVDRFNLFLREYSDLSQFIVITHRKRSIAEADTIYGITMEEAGVSTIVSYRLKEKAS